MDVVVKYRINVSTKLFCSCAQGDTCEVCRRVIGMIPTLNSEALRKTVIAATLIGSNLTLSTFSRVPCVHEGILGFVRSTCLSPIGINGSLDKTGPISIYLEEALEIHDGLCGGMPLLCFKAEGFTDSAISRLTSILESNGIIIGGPEITDPSPNEAPTLRDNLLPEPELDMCMVHIDPYTAEQILSGEEIPPMPIDMG